MYSVDIILSWTEWLSIQNHIGESKLRGFIRKRFYVGFFDLINNKLQIHSDCSIGMGHNWFRKSNSQRSESTSFWSGSYKCKEKCCKVDITMKIEQLIENTDVSVKIVF